MYFYIIGFIILIYCYAKTIDYITRSNLTELEKKQFIKEYLIDILSNNYLVYRNKCYDKQYADIDIKNYFYYGFYIEYSSFFHDCPDKFNQKNIGCRLTYESKHINEITWSLDDIMEIANSINLLSPFRDHIKHKKFLEYKKNLVEELKKYVNKNIYVKWDIKKLFLLSTIESKKEENNISKLPKEIIHHIMNINKISTQQYLDNHINNLSNLLSKSI